MNFRKYQKVLLGYCVRQEIIRIGEHKLNQVNTAKSLINDLDEIHKIILEELNKDV